MALRTPLTDLFGIDHPVLLAGMNQAAGPELAAAVSNAGGLGVIGGLYLSPKMLQRQITEIKRGLRHPDLPFGVDLLLPATDVSARATNYDYTKGKLSELIDVIAQSGCKLFVCAVGTPPIWAVDRLHNHGVVCMNVIGSPKHVEKALSSGADIICAQGGEGGGHTGTVASSVLLPTVVDLCRGRRSPLTGEPVQVLGAGGIFDGRGLASALAMGATGVWIGTRFVASVEAGASEVHKRSVVDAGADDTIRTIIYTGRPMRARRDDINTSWEEDRQGEIKALATKGVIPAMRIWKELEAADAADPATPNDGSTQARVQLKIRPLIMGQAAGAIGSVLPAKQIIDEMVAVAVERIKCAQAMVVPSASL